MNVFPLILGLGIVLVLFGLRYIKSVLKEGFESSDDLDMFKVDTIVACKALNTHIETYQNIIDVHTKDGESEYSMSDIIKFMGEFKKAYAKYECNVKYQS